VNHHLRLATPSRNTLSMLSIGTNTRCRIRTARILPSVAKPRNVGGRMPSGFVGAHRLRRWWFASRVSGK
jgi:hypothetical protein